MELLHIFNYRAGISQIFLSQLNYYVTGIELEASKACDCPLLVLSVLNRESYLPPERGKHLATVI